MAYLDATSRSPADADAPAYWRTRLPGARTLSVGAVLALLVLGRLLPASWQQAADSVLGRPGDTVLLVVALMLLSLWLQGRPARAAQPQAVQHAVPGAGPLQGMLDQHLQLDLAMDGKLSEIVQDTENSALAIIGEVRALYDTANTLVQYLESSSPQASDLGRDIVDSVESLVEIGEFIQNLPVKMAREMQSVHDIVKEIAELSNLVGAVQAISMQSHLLAINAAIEGSRAGPSGAAFRIVASEMRLLASNSSTVATQINQGLARTRAVLEGGMAQGIAQSSQRLEEVSMAAVSIQKLHDNFEDMSQYFKTRFAVVTKHNFDLARDIGEVLGHIQYQDVVSQCVNRLRFSIGERNAFFQHAVQRMQQGADLSDLPEALERICSAYQAEEAKHLHSARHDEQASGELKFELF